VGKKGFEGHEICKLYASNSSFCNNPTPVVLPLYQDGVMVRYRPEKGVKLYLRAFCPLR